METNNFIVTNWKKGIIDSMAIKMQSQTQMWAMKTIKKSALVQMILQIEHLGMGWATKICARTWRDWDKDKDKDIVKGKFVLFRRDSISFRASLCFFLVVVVGISDKMTQEKCCNWRAKFYELVSLGYMKEMEKKYETKREKKGKQKTK